MTTSYIIEKYNNLNLEEDFINNYLYRPINIKHSEVILFKKPKKFYVNKLIENFRTNKKGNLKTLREFQNLYIHKFIIHQKNQEEKEMKNHCSFATPKNEKNKHINKEIFNVINNEIKQQRPFSNMDYLKRANILLSPSLKRNSSYFINRKSSQLSFQNHYKNININSLIQKNNNNNNKPSIKNKSHSSFSFIKKSKLSLIKEVSQKALNQKINIIKTPSEYLEYSLSKNNSICFNEIQNIKKINKKNHKKKSLYSKNNIDLNLKKKKIDNNKYIEISRNYCSLSQALVIEKQITPDSRRKNKFHKRPRIPLRLFSSGIQKMSTLEKYYLRFGVFPYYY